jgi:hypothetical protein
MRAARRRCLRTCILILTATTPAFAQSEAPVGVRAAGMGGAFTAVADDGSAAFWNPAGFASGSFFSLVVDANRLDRRSGFLVALGTPPLGLSYYRTAIAEVKNGRHTLVAHHAGVSLVQSLGGRLAVGTTLKVVHGIASGTEGAGITANKFDADLGVMAIGSLGQLGLSVRNVLQPEFRTPAGSVRLDRRVRAGVSIHARQNTTVAADLDLTRGRTPRGDWRDAALGVETHPTAKAWLRGGLHWNTSHLRSSAASGGEAASVGAAPIGSVGGSYTLYGATVVDAQASFGSGSGDRGWGIGLRFVF